MNELDKLANELDGIDAEFGDAAGNRSHPSWSILVSRKDSIANDIDKLIKTVPASFPLSSYILSSSSGRQVVAIHWIRLKKDPTYLNLACYMLLNSSSNFLKYYILQTLTEISEQCDYHQLVQIRQTLLAYFPPEQSSRLETKQYLLNKIRPQIEFSVNNIIKDSYWWKDVESKFFNSLSGISQYRLCDLQIIRNARLAERFDQCRVQFRKHNQILFVYHGSSPQCLQGIAKDGFREVNTLEHMPDSISKLDPGYFGQGIYHGFAADYAIHYAEHHRSSNEIMLSMVLPGRSYIVKKGGEKMGRNCEPGFDSHISPKGKEIVLFKSAQILPLFIIKFIRIPNSEIDEEQY